MKILVTFFSQTGNTQKIAEAICQETSLAFATDLKPLDSIKALDLAEYGLVFFGAPIHAGGLGGAAKEFLEAMPESPGLKLAGFVTHSSFAYEPQGFESGMKQIKELPEAKGVTYLGSYDCQGYLTDALHPMVQKAQNASDEEWSERMAESKEHPNAEDKEKAKEFAKEILAKL